MQYSEILAYFQLHRIAFDAMELYLIDILDGVAMEYFAEKQKQEEEKNKRKKK